MPKDDNMSRAIHVLIAAAFLISAARAGDEEYKLGPDSMRHEGVPRHHAVAQALTPPPLLRMQLSVFQPHGDGVLLDSKPLVPNVDHYCDRVGFGDWKFCETRPEGHPERVACDYLATGKADNGRWGPTWIGEGKPCGAEFSLCALHPDNQFLAIAKGKGEFKACASELAPVAANGDRCGTLDYY